MQYGVYFLIAIVGLFLIVKLFSWPIKMFIKLLINGVLGAILLFVVNFVGANFNMHIEVNVITALIAGFFGVPGVIVLVIFKVLL